MTPGEGVGAENFIGAMPTVVTRIVAQYVAQRDAMSFKKDEGTFFLLIAILA